MSVFLPSNGSLVLPPTNRSYGMGVPVRHAAYPVAPGMPMGMPMSNMGVPMNPHMAMQPVYNNGGVHTVVASQPPYAGSFVGSGSTVVMPSTPYHHPQPGMVGMPMTAASYPGYTYGGSPYYPQTMGMGMGVGGMGMGQPTTIIVPSSSRRHRRSSSSHSSHSHRRSRSRDY
ncbi:hypothetical protein ONZ45_g5850 [Pleurotus djamor]|nr:hypothetical protein ONZ45_g5850 [Pleurotus djamor]